MFKKIVGNFPAECRSSAFVMPNGTPRKFVICLGIVFAVNTYANYKFARDSAEDCKYPRAVKVSG